MLPSRGIVRASPALGLHKTMLLRSTSRSGIAAQLGRAGSSRQFGTALGSNGRPSPSSRAALLGAAPGTRLGAAATGLLASPLLLSRHARYASTQPAAPSAPLADAASSAAAPPVALSTDLSALPADIDGSALLNMPEHIGYLKALGLDFGWGFTSMMQWCLEHIHVYSGLPWWGTILTASVLLRAALWRPTLTATEHSQKLQELQRDPRYKAAYDRMMSEAMAGGAKTTEVQQCRAEMARMQRAVGFSLWRTFVPMINIPVAFGMFRLLRSMAALPVPGLETGGLLWFTDLSLPDPFMILPIATAGSMFLMMRGNLPFVTQQQALMMKTLSYVLSPLSVLATMNMASGLQFYFLISSLLQWANSWVVRQPWFRRWMKMPPMQVGGAASPAAGGPAGSQWQAPRTIGTTATAAAAPEVASTGGKSMVEDAKETWRGVRKWMDDRSAKGTKESEVSRAQRYEERRRLEEKEAYYARREEFLARQERKGKL